MRRISIQIRSKRNPETAIQGYLVLHELSTGILTFFSTRKFNHEEELEILAEIHGSMKKYEVELLQCNEQISSGRVMTSLPVDGMALPTRTFYRCFTKIHSLTEMKGTTETSETAPAEGTSAEPAQPIAEAQPNPEQLAAEVQPAPEAPPAAEAA